MGRAIDKEATIRSNALIFAAALAALTPLALWAAGDAGSPAPPRVAANPDYEAGKKAVEAHNYKAALDSFNRALAKEPDSADIHNYLGYSWRKSGNLDMAFKHYNEALKIDPKHKAAHEYIGEAYLMANDLPKAEDHLKQLDKICFFSCEEYRELKQAIEDYKRKR
jgi:Flp pilus assembly protein TadD